EESATGCAGTHASDGVHDSPERGVVSDLKRGTGNHLQDRLTVPADVLLVMAQGMMDRIAPGKHTSRRVPAGVVGIACYGWRVEFDQPGILLFDHCSRTGLGDGASVVDRAERAPTGSDCIPVDRHINRSAGITTAQHTFLAVAGGEHVGSGVVARVV